MDSDTIEQEEKQAPAVKEQPVDEKMMEQGMTKETADKILTAQRKKKEELGIQKSGAGSRGGKVIGQTKTGKPIYAPKAGDHTPSHANSSIDSDTHNKLAHAHLTHAFAAEDSGNHVNAIRHNAIADMHQDASRGDAKGKKRANNAHKELSGKTDTTHSMDSHAESMARDKHEMVGHASDKHNFDSGIGTTVRATQTKMVRDAKANVSSNPNPDKKPSDPIVQGVTARGKDIVKKSVSEHLAEVEELLK